MRTLVAVAAESIVRDADDNTVSVINIIEGIAAQGFPTLIQRLAFFVLTEREANEAQVHNGHLTIQLGNQQLLRVPAEMNFQNKLRHRSMNRIGGLIIPQPGRLTLTLDMGNAYSASYSFSVEPTAEAAAAPTVATQAG